MTLGGTCGLQAEQQLVLTTMKPLYPKPHRNQLLEGLRPTLELNTFHRWPAWFFLLSVASRTAPNVAPASAKVEGFSGETTEMSRATGFPRFHFCNRISAGRECERSGKSPCQSHSLKSVEPYLSMFDVYICWIINKSLIIC